MQNAPQLPKELLNRISKSNDDGAHGSHQKSSIGRKRRRKAERTTKKLNKTRNPRQHEAKESKGFLAESNTDSATRDRPVAANHKLQKIREKSSGRNPRRQPSNSAFSGGNAIELGPFKDPDGSSKKFLSNEDRDILALERKLGIKGNKSSNPVEEDGLEDLLIGGGGSSESDGSFQSDVPEEISSLKRKRIKVDKTAKSKRKKLSDESDQIEYLRSDRHTDGSSKIVKGSAIESEAESFDGLSVDETESDVEGGSKTPLKDRYEILRNRKSNRSSRMRENPYIAPSTSASNEKLDETKHKPLLPSSGSESNANLKRQLQGLLNRLTESNLVTVFREIEKKFRDNPRQSVTSTLTELVLDSVADEVALNETFLVLQAAFATSLYRAIGVDFGAYMVECVVTRIDRHYEDTLKARKGKECFNLVTFLADLFLFNSIGSNLIFDYIQLFLKSISEANTELLLRLVKTCGTQLRQDDPLALKDIVTMLQGQIGQMNEGEVSVRTKFMVESITALKNNRMRTNAAGSSIISEQVTRMRKLLGSLSSGTSRTREPLRVKLDDVRKAPQRGKWWLVGASWKEAQHDEHRSEEQITAASTNEASSILVGKDDSHQHESGDEDDMDLDFVKLAKEQLMITDVRRSIFVAIMSASDYRDAYIRLMKLKLKRVQEAEVPRVLLHCAAAESSYNPYYSLLARRLCGAYRLRISFQYSLWHFLGRLQKRRPNVENDSDDDDDDVYDDLSNRHMQNTAKWQLQSTKIVNYAHLYGSLIAQTSLPLSILKVIEFDRLQSQTKLFMEILLITIILDSQKHYASSSSSSSSRKLKQGYDQENLDNKKREENLLRIFSDARDIPELAQGLQHFVQRVMLSSDIVKEHARFKVIKWACGMIEDVLLLAGAV